MNEKTNDELSDRVGRSLAWLNALIGGLNVYFLIVDIATGAPVWDWLISIAVFCFVGLGMWHTKLINRRWQEIDRLAKINRILGSAEGAGLHIVRVELARPGSDVPVIMEEFGP